MYKIHGKQVDTHKACLCLEQHKLHALSSNKQTFAKRLLDVVMSRLLNVLQTLYLNF